MKPGVTSRKRRLSWVIASVGWCLLQANVQAQDVIDVDDPHVPMTDLMVNLPEADLDAFARDYLRESARPPRESRAPSQKQTVATPIQLDIKEVILERADWLAEINSQADMALANNNWPLAELKLAQALAEYPNAHASRLRLAALLYGRGALGQTRAVLQQGIELAPDHADLRLTLARLLTEQQRFAAALHQLNETRPTFADNLDYYSLQAEVARRSGQCQQAIETYRQLLTHTRVGAWWLGMGLCQRELGEEYGAAFMQARASADLGSASQQFVEQQLKQLQQREQDGKAQTY